jgi:Ca2+/Na+ antiporter
MAGYMSASDIGENLGRVYWFVVVIAAIAFTLSALRYRKIKTLREIVNDNLAVLVVALFPVIWTIALLNHTAYHWFFTYRISMITSFASIIVSIYIFQPRKKKKKKYKPEKLRII